MSHGFGAAIPSIAEVYALRSKRDHFPRVLKIPIVSLLPADSPRSCGEDGEHIQRLAESGAELPPILVQRGTMRVIDGMHRLRAAILNGYHSIEVEFFDGGDEEAFIRAVE